MTDPGQAPVYAHCAPCASSARLAPPLAQLQQALAAMGADKRACGHGSHSLLSMGQGTPVISRSLVGKRREGVRVDWGRFRHGIDLVETGLWMVATQERLRQAQSRLHIP